MNATGEILSTAPRALNPPAVQVLAGNACNDAEAVEVQGRTMLVPEAAGAYKPTTGVMEAVDEAGKVELREYVVKDVLHRDPKDGPAVEMFHTDGSPMIRDYWVNGLRSRNPVDGPAVEWFDEHGAVCKREYWVGGHKVAAPASGTGTPQPAGQHRGCARAAQN